MSMSTHVVGLKAPTFQYIANLNVLKACREAKIDPPQSVVDFFDGDMEPEADGIEVKIRATEWSADSRDGLEVVLKDLPEGVTRIRFYNAY